jgi:hypothetical protein
LIDIGCRTGGGAELGAQADLGGRGAHHHPVVAAP